VVASRWNVDSQATSRMVACFYKQLLAGASVAESLRSAGESIRETAGWSHPYYWAAFSAFGRDEAGLKGRDEQLRRDERRSGSADLFPWLIRLPKNRGYVEAYVRRSMPM
jgi:hypothetical protein